MSCCRTYLSQSYATRIQKKKSNKRGKDKNGDVGGVSGRIGECMKLSIAVVRVLMAQSFVRQCALCVCVCVTVV